MTYGSIVEISGKMVRGGFQYIDSQADVWSNFMTTLLCNAITCNQTVQGRSGPRALGPRPKAQIKWHLSLHVPGAEISVLKLIFQLH